MRAGREGPRAPSAPQRRPPFWSAAGAASDRGRAASDRGRAASKGFVKQQTGAVSVCYNTGEPSLKARVPSSG